jgi:hypothetical protein
MTGSVKNGERTNPLSLFEEEMRLSYGGLLTETDCNTPEIVPKGLGVPLVDSDSGITQMGDLHHMGGVIIMAMGEYDSMDGISIGFHHYWMDTRVNKDVPIYIGIGDAYRARQPLDRHAK